MSSSDKEDGRSNKTRLREGFVLDASVSALEIPYQEDIIYRRVNAETPFMTSSFDSHTDDEFALLPPSDKILFTTSPATLQDLDDGSSSVLGIGSVHNGPMDCSLDAENINDTAVKELTNSREFVPTGEVPVAAEVAYHQVNPMFESCEPPTVIFCNLYKAMEAQDIDFSCSPDWTIVAYALVGAEEVCFSVQLHRLATKSLIRVDFTLRLGDELKFLRLTDSIRKECRSIDRDMMGLPELRLVGSQGALFGSLVVKMQELSMLLFEINSESPPFTRYELAKELKALCQYDSICRAFFDHLKEMFVTCLQSMLRNENEEVVRLAICTILNFTSGIPTLKDLNLPQLPETLCVILTPSLKKSTKRLASDLYGTINV